MVCEIIIKVKKNVKEITCKVHKMVCEIITIKSSKMVCEISVLKKYWIL